MTSIIVPFVTTARILYFIDSNIRCLIYQGVKFEI